MKLKALVGIATNKDRFLSIANYSDFCSRYLEFIQSNLQAVIVSRNENNYRFFQYKKDGTYNVTRPINSDLMLSLESFESSKDAFAEILSNIRDTSLQTQSNRKLINRFVYTCQQAIGAALDALPAKKSNTARKLNGDLFERLIRLVISEIGVDVTDGVVSVPVTVDGEPYST